MKINFRNIKITKKTFIYLLSFFIPIILMVLIFIMKGIFPFGNRSFLRTDLYHQYAPFYSELLYKIQNFKSILYSYDVGLGTNFISIISYYLSSPFNILLLFVNQKYVIEFITYAIVLKMGLSGLTFSIFIINRYKNEKLYIIFFAIFYAMSGYFAAYSWNIMWLDCIWLFPLLILSFDNMFYNDKPFLYIIVLALTILTNYYIATMECFFIIIYFIICNILSNIKTIKKFLLKLFNTFLYSLLGVMISAILLLPTIVAFNTTGSSKFDFPSRLNEYFPILDMVVRHLPNVLIENGLEHWPNIFCGTFVICLFVLYLYNKKINIKEKITYIVLILFFYASFSLNIMNFVWHVFRYPNSLPARQSFIYVFFILIICYKSLHKIKNVNKENVLSSFAISIVFIVLSEKLVSNDKINFRSYYIGLIFLLFYFILLYLYIYKKSSVKYIFILALSLCCIESFMNMAVTSVTTIDRSKYVEDFKDIKFLNKYIKEINKDFYRIERIDRTAKDDGAFFNFPSASIFSSTAYKSGTDFYKNLGCEASMNAYSITGSTPFVDSLLSIKYAFYNNKQVDNEILNIRELNKGDKVYLYQNKNVLPLSFVFDEPLLNVDYNAANPATVQNNFSRALSLDTMLDKIKIDINKTKATFEIAEDGNYYAFVRDKSISTVAVQYPTTSKTFKNLDRGFFIELGVLKKGNNIEIRNDTNEKDMLVEVFRFNYDNLKTLNNYILSNGEFEIISFDDTNIVYNMDSKIDGRCIVSLPYDKGFTITVDGKKVETKSTYDFFLSFDINRGKHKINITYMPQGFILGIFISILGIILTLILYIFKNSKKNFKLKHQKNIYEI